MNSRIAVALICLFSMISCKKEVKPLDVEKEPVATIEQELDKELLKVSFDLIVKKDDNFHLYYTEDGTINFDEKKSIWLPVKGGDEIQEVTFKLPENVLPTHLRVDFGFGKNEAQSDIDLKSFRLKYYDKIFEAKDASIFNYFYPNIDNTINPINTTILKKKVKDQEVGPILYPQETLTIELAKLMK